MTCPTLPTPLVMSFKNAHARGKLTGTAKILQLETRDCYRYNYRDPVLNVLPSYYLIISRLQSFSLEEDPILHSHEFVTAPFNQKMCNFVFC